MIVLSKFKLGVALILVAYLSSGSSFAPLAHTKTSVATLKQMTPSLETFDTVGSFDPFNFASSMVSISNEVSGVEDSLFHSSSNLLSFTDQGQNLAGIFFQASLLPYLAFLYFLSFRGNRTPALGNFGWRFLLLFVLSTIPSGIITKGNYGVSLADCDWLHGSAEALLTITNLLIVGTFLS